MAQELGFRLVMLLTCFSLSIIIVFRGAKVVFQILGAMICDMVSSVIPK